MRAHLNQRAADELLEIMKILGETSTSHTLNKLISRMHKEIVDTHHSEVNINVERSTQNQ